MKTMNKFLLFFSLIAMTAIGYAQPCASFTYNVNNSTVTFTNTSTCSSTLGAYANWTFGDGQVGYGNNVSHTYTATGSYWVRLDIIDTLSTVLDTIAQAVVITSLNPPSSATVVSGQLSNHNGVPTYVYITGQMASSGSVIIQAQTDSSGYYIDSISAILANNSVLKAKLTDCNGKGNINTTTYVTTTSSYSLNLDYCPAKPIQALFSKTQAIVSGSPVPGQIVITDLSTGSNLSYLWNFGDGSTSTAISPTHTYAGNGPYILCLTVSDSGYTDMYCDTLSVDSNGIVMRRSPGFTINVGGYNPTGINDVEVSSLKMYPNPTHGLLYIEFTETGKNVNLEIIDMKGQLVLKKNIQANRSKMKLDVSNLNRGLYMVKIISGENIVSERLIIE